MRNSMYHRILRVSAVVCALVLLFESGLAHRSTAQISQNTHSYLANAIGMSASVEPTELNTLTAELTKQKLALDSREAELREREIQVKLNGGDDNEQATYILASVLFVLLVLIILNYGLDYIRAKEQRVMQLSKAV